MLSLLPRFLGELGLLDLLFEIGELVPALVVAEFLLDRLHLLVEIVFALGLLHLALDARADALLDLEHRNLALHQPEHLLQARGDRQRLQDRLLVGNLDGEMRSHGVGELGVIRDLLDHADDFGRDLLVELHIALELVDDRARQRFGLDLSRRRYPRARPLPPSKYSSRSVYFFTCARAAPSTSTFTVPSGSLSSCRHAGKRAGVVDGIRRRIVVGGVLLRRQQNERVRAHHFFERLDGLLAADEQRNDHVRENNDVPQRQHRIGPAFAGRQDRFGFGGTCHGPTSLLLCTSITTRRMRCHNGLPLAGKGLRTTPCPRPQGRVRDPARFSLRDCSYALFIRTL